MSADLLWYSNRNVYEYIIPKEDVLPPFYGAWIAVWHKVYMLTLYVQQSGNYGNIISGTHNRCQYHRILITAKQSQRSNMPFELTKWYDIKRFWEKTHRSDSNGLGSFLKSKHWRCHDMMPTLSSVTAALASWRISGFDECIERKSSQCIINLSQLIFWKLPKSHY